MEHIKNDVLGPKFAIRLGDLGWYHRLRAVCFKCRKETVIDPEILRARFDANTFIVGLEERIRCGGCGNRFGNRLSVGQLARD